MVTKSRRVRSSIPVIAAVLALAASGACRSIDAQPTDSIVDHFKYGSIGTEKTVGVPFPIWRVLPIVFEDKLPKRPGTGYERLGFVSEGRERPIGTTNKDGRIGLNCATCHTGTVRDDAAAAPRIVLGMPAHQMDLQGYARFLTATVNDPRFNYTTLVEAIQKVDPSFSWWDRLTYRLFVISAIQKAVRRLEVQNSWFDKRPPQGPGRVDTFNPYKRLLGFDMDADDTVGTADLPSLWNQRVRRGLWLHWDGNNDLVEERNKSAAIGAGATPESLDLDSLKRIEDWILDFKPQAFPQQRLRPALVDRGRHAYQTACSRCHDLGSKGIGQVVEIGEIKTDPERLRSFTPELAVKMNSIGSGYPWRFTHFRKTNGYSSMPLDGIWLRAPYLHNGSVPTLRALMFPDERPAVFFRGYDVYDWDNGGFVSTGPAAETGGVRFDTSQRGNGSGGHLYGTDLPVEDRQAIIEYLKTL